MTPYRNPGVVLPDLVEVRPVVATPFNWERLGLRAVTGLLFAVTTLGIPLIIVQVLSQHRHVLVVGWGIEMAIMGGLTKITWSLSRV